jgi:hypothetical protein
VLALLDWRATTAEDTTEWIRFIVVVLWLTWMFSSLLSYWGAKKTVSVLLLSVGSFWAVFVIATLTGEFQVPRTADDIRLMLLGFGAGIMFVGPFFLLAWTVRRWPRVTGWTLLAVSVLLLIVLLRTPDQQWSTIVMTRTMLVGPMVAAGIALLIETAKTPADGRKGD